MSVHSGNVAVYIYYISRFIYTDICCSIFECRFILGTSCLNISPFLQHRRIYIPTSLHFRRRGIYIYTYSHLNIYSFPFIISYNISFVNSLLYTELFCLFYFLGMWSGGRWWWCICVWCSSCRVVFWICQWWPRMVCQPTEAFGVLEYLCAGRRLSQFFFHNMPRMAKDGVPAYRGIRSTGISLCRPEALAIFFLSSTCQGWPRMVCQPTEAFGVLEYLCAGRRLSQFFFWVQHSLRYGHNYTFQRGSYGIFVGAAHHFCTTQMENPASHTAPPPLHVWLDFLYHVTWYQLSFLSVLLHL
jgi:hypothetical protein